MRLGRYLIDTIDRG